MPKHLLVYSLELDKSVKHNHCTSCHSVATDLQVYTPDTLRYLEQLRILMMLQLSQWPNPCCKLKR